ncbi:hypothetical protein J1N51_03870 [Psychrosphaera ytuae]|uniref:Uncharacterized protein n=1 Tax=Psychrosphaera ytuae TaxID=2820710 RepID=A0A975DE00_9GAMM|nr:hypothetical protein [Psychrosphaera ytuae]QTH64616.1 hypothetical protein J1N51_03870 [Psychrosphaera ytuae]
MGERLRGVAAQGCAAGSITGTYLRGRDKGHPMVSPFSELKLNSTG